MKKQHRVFVINMDIDYEGSMLQHVASTLPLAIEWCKDSDFEETRSCNYSITEVTVDGKFVATYDSKGEKIS